jgi:hypothetical protein
LAEASPARPGQARAVTLSEAKSLAQASRSFASAQDDRWGLAPIGPSQLPDLSL